VYNFNPLLHLDLSETFEYPVTLTERSSTMPEVNGIVWFVKYNSNIVANVTIRHFELLD